MQPRSIPKLEEFRNCNESQLIELMLTCIGSRTMYGFGELLALPSVEKLANSEGTKKYHNLLTLFAYGKYKNYLAKKDSFPPLSDEMLLKLRHLTILSLAQRKTEIPYSELFSELDLDAADIRSLEDIIIDAIYNNVLVAKMDHSGRKLFVKWHMGRDVHPKQFGTLMACLDGYATVCEETLVETRRETSAMESGRLSGPKISGSGSKI